MREIKIRVWDGVRFYYSDEKYSPITEICLTSVGVVANAWSQGGEHLYDIKVKDSNLYTGLKDKNGKDIYESDVVKILKGHKDHLNKNYIIVFQCGSFGLKYKDAFNKHTTPLPIYHKAAVDVDVDFDIDNTGSLLEVVGNVHKNPELINTIP